VKEKRVFRKKKGQETEAPKAATVPEVKPEAAPVVPSPVQTYAHEAKPPLDLSKVLPTHQITPKFKFT
jgi:hypothetical protein